MIENESILGVKARNSLFWNTRHHRLVCAFLLTFFLLQVVLGLLSLFSADPPKTLDLTSCISQLCTWGIIILGFFLFPIRPAGFQMEPAKVRFVFTEAGMEVEIDSPLGHYSARLGYFDLRWARDSKEYIFLDPTKNPNAAFCLSKSGFTIGTAEELLDLLKKHGVNVR